MVMACATVKDEGRTESSKDEPAAHCGHSVGDGYPVPIFALETLHIPVSELTSEGLINAVR